MALAKEEENIGIKWRNFNLIKLSIRKNILNHSFEDLGDLVDKRLVEELLVTSDENVRTTSCKNFRVFIPKKWPL